MSRPTKDTKRKLQLTPEEFVGMRSQFATTSAKRRLSSPPRVFTEFGAIMAANVLNSPQAVTMSVFVVRAFVKLREQLLNRAEIEKRLSDIEKNLLAHDAVLRDLYQKLRPLILPPQEPPRSRIGFSAKERRAHYTVRKAHP